MKKKTKTLLKTLLACSITTIFYQNCAPAFQSNQVVELSSLRVDVSFSQFQKVVETNCNHCHGGADSLYPSVTNFKNFTSEASWLIQPELIVAGDRKSSTMYNRLTFAEGQVTETKNNMPFAVENYPFKMTAKDAEVIGGYIESLNRASSSPVVDTAPAEGSLAKIKMIVNGKAVTSDEFTVLIRDKKLNRAALKQAIYRWLETPESQQKMQDFFSLTMDQDDWVYPEAGNELIGQLENTNQNKNRDRWLNNVKDSFGRTALEIVNKNEPFNKIVTTNEWQLTTALLSTLSFVDGAGAPAAVNDNNTVFSKEVAKLNETDFNDWKTVKLEKGDGIPYRNYGNIRNVKEGDVYSLNLPRIGYFNTLAFQLKYPTNDANDFRVTASQTLLVATNKEFEAGDTTPEGDLSALDEVHAGPTTSCYQCHRHLDPIKETFKWSYNEFYRSSGDAEAKTPAFSFQGHQGAASNIQELAQTISKHPEFATGWTAKLCSYANSDKCDENSTEFRRIASLFESSNFNFKTLLAELFSSPIVTSKGGGIANSTNPSTMGLISVARSNHFCHAMNQRYIQIRDDLELDARAFDLCNLNGTVAGYASSLGADLTVRGSAGLSQSPDSSPVGYLSMENICRTFSTQAVGNNTIKTGNNDIEASLTIITKYVMGLPAGHSRHEKAREVLKEIYDYGKSEHNLSNQNSLREAFVFACLSPDNFAMGL